jgi:hypothetical protein
MCLYIILIVTYGLLCNSDFIFLYYLHKHNSPRVIILSLFFLHVVSHSYSSDKYEHQVAVAPENNPL